MESAEQVQDGKGRAIEEVKEKTVIVRGIRTGSDLGDWNSV
jgi:hypothetical protein